MKAARIAETFSVSLFTGNLALLIIRGRVNPADYPRRFPQTVRWVGQCYHKPNRQEVKLEALNELLECHGVEAITVDDAGDVFYGECHAEYLNVGDSYTDTLLLDHQQNRWKLTSWADWVEAAEARARAGEADA